MWVVLGSEGSPLRVAVRTYVLATKVTRLTVHFEANSIEGALS